MIESSHKQEDWYSLEQLSEQNCVWFAHLLIRWDELQVTEQAEEGERIGYQYTAQRIQYALPESAPKTVEELSVFIESLKELLITVAQNRLAQSGGLSEGPIHDND